MTTPKQIKTIRESLELDQAQFAEKLGTSRQFISDMERGVKPISLKTEAKLRELGLLDTKEEATPERPEWLKNLTENEELMLQEMIKKDKELLLLFFGACTGEEQKVKLFCQYLAARYNVKT